MDGMGCMGRQTRWFTVAVVMLSVCSVSGVAAAADASRADYERMLEGRYSASMPVPAGGLTLTRDVATWILESGQVRLLQPTAGGRITGLVFEGIGRFQMEVPDPVEQAQLARMAEKDGMDGVDVPFSTMVLRTAEGMIDTWFPQPPSSFTGKDSAAADRHRHWLEQRFEDVDARVLCGLLTPGDDYLRADVDTQGYGWLTFDFDGQRREEIRLSRFDNGNKFTEHWVSLDRADDRDAAGRPNSDHRPLFDLKHVEVTADLREASKKTSRVGFMNILPRQGRYDVTVTVEPLIDGPEMLRFALSPLAKVEMVSEEGRPLTFVRDHIGGRSSSMDNRFHDNELLVLLDQPLQRGEQREIKVVYERETLNYLPGSSWYPTRAEAFFRDSHTANFTITARKKHHIRAMGTLIDETVEGDDKTVRYRVEQPVKMATFSFAERFHEETIQSGEAPEVVAFAASSGSSVKAKTYNVAADLANSLNYFQQLFANPLATKQLYATSILGRHGQSFEGFLHLSESTFEYESKGPTERFRAHEAAHQWWGHVVGWDSYRDQWLSEAFAEYSALMFVQAALEDGQKEYDDFIEDYFDLLLGIDKVLANANRTGPIGVGRRAATGDIPGGYQVQIYRKGAVVLHMLRTLLHSLTKSDDVFIKTLQTFVADFQGGDPSTQDFVDTLTKVAPGDWQWFFDQWVFGTDIPTYSWRHEVVKDPSGRAPFAVQLTVEQRGVADGFRMPVPVKLDFGKGKTAQVVVLVDEPIETFSIPVPQKPRKVEFNAGRAVLARIKGL